ncbi:MAG: mechanosensitive ion channel [Acidobacteriota bacterium]|nr:mechanosensitive ion channel [Acidobacteriota bacterium]
MGPKPRDRWDGDGAGLRRWRCGRLAALGAVAGLVLACGVRQGRSQANSQQPAVQELRQAAASPTHEAAQAGDPGAADTSTSGTLLEKAGEKGKDKKEKKAAGVPSLDIRARSGDVLAHLNEIVGFYRLSLTPIQKAGEPNDVVYFDRSVDLASQAAVFAFQSAKAEATLLAAHHDSTSGPGEQQRLETTKTNVERQLAELKAEAEALDKQIQKAKGLQEAALRQQRKDIAAAIDLNTSMDASLEKIVGMAEVQGTTGLTADVARLERSVPQLYSKTRVVAPQVETLDAARSAGVSSQGAVLFQLLGTKRELGSLLEQNEEAQKAAAVVRGPLSAVLRNLVKQGQELSAAAAAPVVVPSVMKPDTKKKGAKGSTPSVAGGAVSGPSKRATAGGTAGTSVAASAPRAVPLQTLDSITTDFNALASAAVPLSQEMIVLEQSKANLIAWQTAVGLEYAEILHALLLRVVVIAIALGIIFVAGAVWRRATNKYIHEARRRRQLLVIRRVTVGLLSALVILFGFVTQFNSLATFAGFITAGIAVGLQTILLSVAAYFFIVGKYGVKVGDRITVSSVTGDVIDVGLVRFYMMELAGTGLELNPTGRVAVFSNAVLFQAGTPLYKQIPGTQFAWHELIVKLAPSADYAKVSAAILKELEGVYGTYRPSIERQHRDVESWMQTPIPEPAIDSRLQFNAGALQLWARFPVELASAAEADEQLTKALLAMMESEEYKGAFAAPPAIQPSVKG